MKYQELVDDSIKNGAQILCGGKVNNSLNGHFFEPTIITNVNPSMRVMREEIFGPIMAIMRVNSDDEAIAIANDCEYGLSCSIFSSNYSRAMDIACKIESGGVTVNDWGLSMLIQALPFGGIKTSGFGKFNGPEGIRDFCNQKTIISDRFKMIFPPPKILMIPTSPKAPFFVEEFLKIFYGPSFQTRLEGITGFFKLLFNK